jgi:POT family proton-dependent oligopeptide transporter
LAARNLVRLGGFLMAVALNASLVKQPAKGTIVPQAMKAFWFGMRGGFKMDAALPEAQALKHQRTVPWDANFIGELKRGLLACRVL